mmetsp:Transcript_72216/g.145297  ORF Transcript_72216/g.145297 Transcript_72216/m.145297 type:complete len:262 (+) Transcript_72216:118-903(+)
MMFSFAIIFYCFSLSYGFVNTHTRVPTFCARPTYAIPEGESRQERNRRRDLARNAPGGGSQNLETELAGQIGEKPCPCRSGDSFKSCCQPFVDRGELPTSPEALLRARFTAYVQGKVDFILLSTHHTHPDFTADVDGWRQELAGFIRSVEFKTFEIISSEEIEEGKKAAVTWKAQMRVLPNILSPEYVQTKEFTERSILLFESAFDGPEQWFYAGGDEDFEPTNKLIADGPIPMPGGGGSDGKPKIKKKTKAKVVAAAGRK